MDIHETGQQLWSFLQHSHDHFSELIYIEKGKLMNHINGVSIELNAGDLMIIREHDVHSLQGRHHSYFNVNFCMSDLESILTLMGKNLSDLGSHLSPHLPVFSVPTDKRAPWVHQLKKMFPLQHREDANPKVITLLSHLCSEFLFPPDFAFNEDHLPSWLKNLLLQVQESEVTPTTAELPQLSQRTAEHISRSMQKYFSCTPSTYLNNIKLDRATLLLSHSHRSILDISMSVGFNHLSYFNAQFKKKYDMSPTQYRKLNMMGVPLTTQ